MDRTLQCLVVEDDTMTRKIVEKFVTQTDFLSLAGSCENGLEAANFLQQNPVDLILLDVEMPEMTGTELVQSLTEVPLVIMITSKPEYAVEAFELDVLDYIVKPIHYPRFMKAVSKARERVEEKKEVQYETDRLFVKAAGQYVAIPYQDIYLVESRSDYVTLHTMKKRYTVYATMKSVIAKLPEKDFLRVHRSYIVRLASVETFEDNTLALMEKLIPVGVTYRDALLKRLNFL